MLKRFAEAKIRPHDIGRFKDQECIILRDEARNGVEYEDTDTTTAMRDRLRAYNELLSGSFIDMPHFDHPIIERRIEVGPNQGGVQRVRFDPQDIQVRRVFSRSSWVKNGRFYGGWWQMIDGTARKKIFINDTPTVEVDFKAMHINMLSLQAGVELEGDPYDLTDGFLEGVDRKAQRKYLKRLVLTAINARNRRSAFQAFRDGYSKGEPGRGFRDEELQALLDEFIRRTPQLEGAICADQGIRLMYEDACVADRILSQATSDGVPVLCVHDSFIVDYNHAKYLKGLMSRHSTAVVGSPLPVASEWLGLDEVPENRREDYAEVRSIKPTPGYLSRKGRFEERQMKAA